VGNKEPVNELEKLRDVFKNVDPAKQKMTEKLLEHTAFLSEQLDEQQKLIAAHGMVRVHPTNPTIQKQTEVGKQYLKTLQAYSLAVKTLNGIYSRNAIEEEDDFDKFMSSDEWDD